MIACTFEIYGMNFKLRLKPLRFDFMSLLSLFFNRRLKGSYSNYLITFK